MKIFRRQREETTTEHPAGVARVDKRTKDLVARMAPGEIAIIDHEDIDRVAAEGLVQRQAKAVINAGRSITGRYPNLGPLLLVSAGIPLLDAAGPSVMEVPDGARVMLDGDRLLEISPQGERVVAKGHLLDLEEIEKQMDEAKRGISASLERFAENTIGYIRDERDVLLEAAHLPEVRTDFSGRQVLVVVRGYDYKEDLRALRSYIREVRPLLVAVDGGADALLDMGFKPDMIIGDMDSVTTEALLSGAELVVHAYPGGFAPGLERLQALDIEDIVVYEATGTSEDIAMLLAYERGAELIVAVGTHANLIEFLDKGRKGMASTFLVRLRVGSILVDAKGVSRLYRGRIRRSDLVMLLGAALVAIVVAFALSDILRIELELYWTKIQNWWFQVKDALF
ncbi:MAG: putative cytokinetic ring protein SteA [Actinomycetota bacterium]